MKKKKSYKTVLTYALMIVLSMLAGFAGARLSGDILIDITDSEIINLAVSLIALYVLLIIAYILTTVIHEGGHLVFGLATGYRFVSFRIGSIMVVKQNDRLGIKRFSLAGTGGQCLMGPPEMRNGAYPFVLYNLGGVIANLIFAAISCFGAVMLSNVMFISELLSYLFVFNVLFAAMNGIPLNTEMVSNDGYNAIFLKDVNAKNALYMQLKINELQTMGLRLKDMDEKLFILPDDADNRNTLISTIAVMRENRLMDMKLFDDAYRLIDVLLSDVYVIPGIYRYLLIMDRICINILKGNTELPPEYTGKAMSKFISSMKNYPAVIRTQYIIEKMINSNAEKAEEFMNRLNNLKNSYPNRAEIDAEIEIIEKICK